MMKTRAVIVAAGILAVLLALAFSPAFATKPTFGKVLITFSEPPSPDAPWHLRIWAVSYNAFQNGKLVLRLRSPGAREAQEVVLWTGSGGGFRDTISIQYSLAPPPRGLYVLSAAIIPFPEKESNRGASLDIIYVAVRANEVLTSRGDFIAIRDRKSTRLNSSHTDISRMPSSA